jgi:hypothetical protein
MKGPTKLYFQQVMDWLDLPWALTSSRVRVLHSCTFNSGALSQFLIDNPLVVN